MLSSRRSERRLPVLLVATVAWGSSVIFCPSTAQTPSFPTFERDIRPILEAHCFRCHGDKKQSGGLDLRGKDAMGKGGETGPALTPGSAEKSLLYEQISKHKMPPGKNEKLSEVQIAL